MVIRIFPALVLAVSLMTVMLPPAQAERVKDLAGFAGVRSNQLIGYGLVVGLDGSGDQTTQTPFTVQSIVSMLSNLGISLPPGTNLQLKNVAAVMVTATLPAFARPGQTIDVTVSSMGNAKSLRGGTLLMTPLKGADAQVYAIAQGNVVVGGVGAQSAGSKVTVNHLSVGRVAAGATVERSVPTALGEEGSVVLELAESGFANAQKLAQAINRHFGNAPAQALDGRQVHVRLPADPGARMTFLGQLEGIEVEPVPGVAKVIINARTGSVVMNQNVTLEPCAVAHGNLSVTVSTEPVISQPAPLSGGTTVVGQKSQIDIKQEGGALMKLGRSANLAELVKALNVLGANPQDLIAILQAMKAAGALRAELEII